MIIGLFVLDNSKFKTPRLYWLGYMATGNYNIITADWNALSNDLTYVIPAFATVHLGTLIARFLENIVELGFIEPSGVHLIGHSLGAHICGATGGAFGPGKIGRITGRTRVGFRVPERGTVICRRAYLIICRTGLDPGTIGFETVNVVRRLNVDDARFVDVIHTSVGTIFGFVKPLGHVDFYANLGVSPQPRCKDEFAHSPFSRLSQSEYPRRKRPKYPLLQHAPVGIKRERISHFFPPRRVSVQTQRSKVQ